MNQIRTRQNHNHAVATQAHAGRSPTPRELSEVMVVGLRRMALRTAKEGKLQRGASDLLTAAKTLVKDPAYADQAGRIERQIQHLQWAEGRFVRGQRSEVRDLYAEQERALAATEEPKHHRVAKSMRALKDPTTVPGKLHIFRRVAQGATRDSALVDSSLSDVFFKGGTRGKNAIMDHFAKTDVASFRRDINPPTPQSQAVFQKSLDGILAREFHTQTLQHVQDTVGDTVHGLATRFPEPRSAAQRDLMDAAHKLDGELKSEYKMDHNRRLYARFPQAIVQVAIKHGIAPHVARAMAAGHATGESVLADAVARDVRAADLQLEQNELIGEIIEKVTSNGLAAPIAPVALLYTATIGFLKSQYADNEAEIAHVASHAGLASPEHVQAKQDAAVDARMGLAFDVATGVGLNQALPKEVAKRVSQGIDAFETGFLAKKTAVHLHERTSE